MVEFDNLIIHLHEAMEFNLIFTLLFVKIRKLSLVFPT